MSLARWAAWCQRPGSKLVLALMVLAVVSCAFDLDGQDDGWSPDTCAQVPGVTFAVFLLFGPLLGDWVAQAMLPISHGLLPRPPDPPPRLAFLS